MEIDGKRIKKYAGVIVIPFLALLSAFAVGSVILLIARFNPIEAYHAIYVGAFGSARAFSQTIIKSAPLMLIGVGIAVAFRGSSFNIGAEGQFYAGALGAILADSVVKNLSLPPFIVIPLLLCAAFVFGGVYGAIPGCLKAYKNASEVVSTVMLSSIMLFLISYLVNGPLQEPRGFYSETEEIIEAAQLPYFWRPGRLSIGFIIAVGIILFFYFILEKTTLGLKIKYVGKNPVAAKYAGISNEYITVLTMTLSGALAGIAGGLEVMGVTWKLHSSISPGYGYTAIAVALLGRLHPIAIIFSALLFGALSTGSNQMARMITVPSTLAILLQALLLLFLIAYFALESKINFTIKLAEKETK